MAPTATHEERVQALHSLATLVGCVIDWPALPDGSRPDALRLNPRTGLLFIGDAKHTETPGCSATLSRFRQYSRAAGVYVASVRATAVLALCHSGVPQSSRWDALLKSSVPEEAVEVVSRRSFRLEGLGVVSWLELIPVGTSAIRFRRPFREYSTNS